MMEVPEEEAPIVTEDTQGQDRLRGREGRQHIPRSEEDPDPDQDPGPRHGGGRSPRGQCRDRDRRDCQDQVPAKSENLRTNLP